jgi:hypothetical protein
MTDDVMGDVTAPPKESQANPSDPWRFSLRATAADKAIVRRVIKAHERMGLTISMNDAILVLIRRSATPDADSQEEAWQEIERHWADCPGGCDFYRIECPEGWRLRDQLHRVKPRDPHWKPKPPPGHVPPANPSPAPPPPLLAAPPATEATGWRRYFGFSDRKAS